MTAITSQEVYEKIDAVLTEFGFELYMGYDVAEGIANEYRHDNSKVIVTLSIDEPESKK